MWLWGAAKLEGTRLHTLPRIGKCRFILVLLQSAAPHMLPGIGVGQTPNHCSRWYGNYQILAGAPVHALAHAMLSILGDKTRLVVLSNKIVQIVIGLENNVATPSAIAA